MTEETNKIAEEALAQGNNSAAARSFGKDLPEALKRDRMYSLVYVGGLVVYGILAAAFLF